MSRARCNFIEVTLVLSLITESWALQVSDRKLVWLGTNGEIVRKDDERNKAVVWCNRLAFAYTGLAELGPKREATDVWLARELSEWWKEAGSVEQRQDALVAAIADRATAAARRPRIARGIPPHLQRHAFVGTGWARFDGRGGMAPYIVQIHNFPSATDREASAKDEFGVAINRLPEGENQIFVNWVGQELDESEKALLEELRRGDPRSREFGDHAAGVMAEIIRTVAERNELVGRGLLINSLPRWAIHPGDTGTILLASAPAAEHLSFLHLPHDTNDPVLRGPRYVCEGRQMANFQAWEPTQEEIHRMTGWWKPHAPPH
jgi:hypothetical protein